MVSTRRKPASKTKGVVVGVGSSSSKIVAGNASGIDTVAATTTTATASTSLDSIVTSNELHPVSCNSSSTSTGSDASTVETTTTKSHHPVAITNTNVNTTTDGETIITSSSSHTNGKSLPKKKSTRPLKPSLKHPSTFSPNTRRSNNNNTPPPPTHGGSPTKRSAFGIGGGSFSSAHTRSNAGAAELLKGVDTVTHNAAFGKSSSAISNKSFVGGVKQSSKSTSHFTNTNNMIGKNAGKQQQHQKDGQGNPNNTDGIVTIRNGLSVRKIVMNTGTLYIYRDTHQAEFVRTK